MVRSTGLQCKQLRAMAGRMVGDSRPVERIGGIRGARIQLDACERE
jgi:hypothetical protein